MNPFQESSVEDIAKRAREKRTMAKKKTIKNCNKKARPWYFTLFQCNNNCIYMHVIDGNMVSRTTKCTCDVKWIKAIKMHKGT
jgi:hypothetical protein